jgi:hypothetical protein
MKSTIRVGTSVCERCAHYRDTLNQRCTKGHGGLYRLALCRQKDCPDFKKKEKQNEPT